jgi:hypothetical protein
MIELSELHYHIVRNFVECGCAPAIADLAHALAESPREVRVALEALEELHGVVLQPTTREIWVAHPFSAAPTNFWIESGAQGWWANCAWCALGAVTLIGGTGTITTTIGAESKQVVLHIENGGLEESGLYVHFPIPMARAWDNVIYTCSTMLLFESDEQVTDWCTRHRLARGDLQPVSRVLEFAKDWYGRHLDRDWTKWSAAEAAALFERHGLTGITWQITTEAARF